VKVVVGDPTTFDLMAFGQAAASTVNYIQSEISRAATVLTDFGQIGFQAAHEVFNRFHGEDAVRKARELSRRIGWVFKEDCVRPLVTLDAMQSAMPVMQRWIMACPEVRELYNRQECAGYAGSYIDIQPGAIADQHYDYRRVMDGMIQTDDDDKPFYTLYMDELLEGDSPLDLDKRVDVLNTWDHIRHILRKGVDDPTSIHGDKLI